MICKKCGAYNPDHATFCKVCAANLKDQDVDDAIEATAAAEESVQEAPKPHRGNVQAPDYSSMRRAVSFRPAPHKVEEPEEADEDDVDVEDEAEEEVKKAPRSARAAAPAKKRRVLDEDEDEDDDDDDKYDEDETAAEKLESEPKTTRFARAAAPAKKARRVVEEEDDDEDEDDDEYENDEYDDDGYDDGDDEYEEYEPTPPRRKNSSRKQSKSGGFNIVSLLIVCLLVILLLIAGIIVFCNVKGGSTQQRLPGFLQINCAGKEEASKNSNSTPQPADSSTPVNDGTEQQAQSNAPVTGTEVDFSATTLEEFISDKGEPSIRINMYAQPGEIITIVLPNQDDWVFQNNETAYQKYGISIPKACYNPNKPLDASVYTVTPEIIITHTDGTQESLHVDSFDLTFPTIQLELVEPAVASIPEEGIMAEEGNELVLKGKVDDHTVTVTVNGQPVANMYEGGNFEYTYSMQTAEPEVVTIEASKANCVTSSYAFTVNPYVFIPEKMPLTVISALEKLRADKDNKVTVTGTTAPGATLTAIPAADYQSYVVCGSPTVDAEGNYAFDVTFDKNYYGIASITIHAKKDGYEEGDTSCVVSRMYTDRKKAINGFIKTSGFYEVPSKLDFASVLSNPSAAGLYRFEGNIVAVDEETGVITFAAKTSAKETTTIYVQNAVKSGTWKPKVNSSTKIYCTLNGLYTDGTSLFVTAWFIP